MLTFPPYKIKNISNIRIFNACEPVHLNTISDVFEYSNEDYRQQNVFNLTPKEFVNNMSNEINTIIRKVVDETTENDQDRKSKHIKEKTNWKLFFIENNRLTYLGFFIVIVTMIIWVLK